ncbi:MAG TPA: hypothetical protein VLT88_02290, partial [Desulfosarcina sp.]|nr:hypothetical protein [Desulfosarcina sp.]
ETAVNRIRSDIRRFQSAGQPADPAEAAFSLRLFLALAQENDMAVDGLDQDLFRINALEKNFLETLNDADDAAFSRQGIGSVLWREDPGARLTAQRIRAWAGLAAADADLPQWLLTTSPAVMAAVLEAHANDCPIEKVAHTRLSVPFEDGPPILGEALEAMAIAESISAVDLSAFHLPTADGTDASVIEVSLYAASDRTPADVLRRMAPKSVPAPASADRPASVRHTLLALVGI